MIFLDGLGNIIKDKARIIRMETEMMKIEKAYEKVQAMDIDGLIKKYEVHFLMPFPERTVLFKLGNPKNAILMDKRFLDHVRIVEEAISKNIPLKEYSEEEWARIKF